MQARVCGDSVGAQPSRGCGPGGHPTDAHDPMAIFTYKPCAVATCGRWPALLRGIPVRYVEWSFFGLAPAKDVQADSVYLG